MASASSHLTERDPLLLPESLAPTNVKKPWYKPSPLWLLPFVMIVSICRGMTVAPRLEVFTQLACEDLRLNQHPSPHRPTNSPLSFSVFPFNDTETDFQPHINADASLHPQAPVPLKPVLSLPTTPVLDHKGDKVEDLDPIYDNPINCTTDPRVQAGAAKMQTVMTTTVGILTVITTGWWGQFGDRHGRNMVFGATVIGLLFTDVMFMIASNPPAILEGRAYYLLIVAPIVEGSLGSWETVTGAMHAYLSDCTSGSRAHLFSLLAGVTYAGFAVGPEIAVIVLRHTHITTFVFFTSAIFAIINLFLVFFVFPESVSAEARTRNIEAAKEARMKASQDGSGKMDVWHSTRYAVKSFIDPLAVFVPVQRAHGRGRDWSLTLVGVATFCFHLSVGLPQFKYLYAKYTFNWDSEALSYYVTATGAVRGLWLLLIFPSVIAVVKPGYRPQLIRQTCTSPAVIDNEASPTVIGDEDLANAAADSDTPPSKEPLPSPSMLVREFSFDVVVARLCVLLDLSSYTLVTLATSSSAPLFVVFSLISASGAGILPALHSVAMCALNLREAPQGGKGVKEAGKLFGALAVLQASGCCILGPILFGITYSMTVAVFPKAIFVLAASLLVVAISMLLMIRPPRIDDSNRDLRGETNECTD